MDETTKQIGSLQAGIFANTAMNIALAKALIRNSVLSADEVSTAFDEALLRLEEMQAQSPSAEHWVFEIARKHLEVFLSPTKKQ